VQLEGQLADPEIVELLKGFVAMKVDLSDRSSSNPHMQIAQDYGVTGIPDIRILGPDGKQTAEVAAEKSAIVAALKKALGK